MTPKKSINPEIESAPGSVVEDSHYKKQDAIPVEEVEVEKSLYATADFEVQGVTIHAGEKFVPPLGWKRDDKYRELLMASRVKQGQPVGIVFSYEGDVINPGEKNPALRERRTHNAVLPLIER